MNVQDTILKGIQQLLYRENFLVLPGFGGFVLKPMSAGYNTTATLLLPASKRPGFNRQLKQNDGVLQSWLQKELFCDASEALKHLEEFTGYCNTLLSTRRRLNMKGLGFFYLDFENNLCFEAQADVNFQAESFGLSPVKLLTIHEPLRDIKVSGTAFADRTAPVSYSSEKPKNRIRQPLKRAILVSAAVLILMITLGALVNFKGIRGQLYANLLNTAKQPVYTPYLYTALNLKNQSEAKEIQIKNGNTVLIIELEPDMQLLVKKPAVPTLNTNLKESTPKPIVENFYTVVLGSFAVPNNAVNFEKQVREKHPEGEVLVLPQHKHRMVSLGRYRDKEMARDAMQQLMVEYPGAWVLKR